MVMLPFHKRARANSIIEIGSEELEAVELPNVRAPSVRPGAFASVRPSSAPMFPQASSRRYNDYDAEEMTVVRMDKRVSTSPPPRMQLEPVRVPYSPPPRFERDDEPTQMMPQSSRPLLSMQSQHHSGRSVIVDQTYETAPPPVSSRILPESPRSAAAVDAASSAHVRAVDMSMTANLSGSTDISKLRRPTMGWATALVAVGVFAGIITAFVARGEGLATAAAFIDPSHQVTADVTKAVGAQVQAQPQAQAAVETQLKPGAGTVVVQSKPAAPSCDANAVPAAKVETKETAKVEAKVVETKVVEAKIERPVAHAYVAPVVHHVEAAPRESAPVVAQAAPPPAITKPAVAKPAHKASGNDMESANAADALAKAQLEAALSR
jgi:hypothetical protein